MKTLKVLLIALLFSAAAAAQSTTTFTASNIQDVFGSKLNGRLCFLGTDGNDVPVLFSVGGSGQVVNKLRCANVAAGIVTATVPNPGTTSPAGIFYRITVIDTSTGNSTIYKAVQWSGASFNFDNYVPSGTVVLPSGGTVQGPITFAGPVYFLQGFSTSATGPWSVVATAAAPSGPTGSADEICLDSSGICYWPHGGSLDHVELQSHKDQVSGYAGLNGSGDVPPAELGTGTPSSTTVLLGSGAWTALSTITAGKATALATAPTKCTAGMAAIGIDASGNAQGCFTPGGGGGSSFGSHLTTIPSSDTIMAAGSFATTISIPATSIVVGSLIEIRAHGIYTTPAGTSPMIMQVNAGGTTAVCPAPGTVTMTSGVIAGPWDLSCMIQINTVSGATSTAVTWGGYEAGVATGANTFNRIFPGTGSPAIYKLDASYNVSVQETATMIASQSFTLQALDVKVIY